MSTLACKNVAYAYEKGKGILTNISFSFESGKMYAILGPSGSGKTTLLSLLGGLDTPAKGNILFDDTDITQTGLEEHRRNHISLIFQNYNLIDYMTPIENTKLVSKVDAVPILQRLGLTEDELRRTVLKLSEDSNSVAIARSLASDAPVILADEPTGNLDEATAAEITEILKESAQEYGKCVIIVTHSNAVAKAADCVLEIKGGTLKVRN
ncbi:MAG: ATP-binding cassette domain-containing protein [Clostridia bacterium]